jgi:hypothetical protein
MKKIDKFLQGETVKYLSDEFRGYLPPDLRRPFDDLMELKAELIPLQRDIITDKRNKARYEKTFMRLCDFFKANPLIEKRETDV